MNFIKLLCLITLISINTIIAQDELEPQTIQVPLTIQDRKNNDLLYAIEAGDLEKVVALIEDGAHVNSLNLTANTPLSVAVAFRQLPIVQFLLKQGADVNLANTSGITPLYRAASLNDLAIVRELLKVPTINVNLADDQGVTPLFCAAYNDNLDIIKELLDRKDINTNPLAHEKYTPADVATNPLIEELLAARGGIESYYIKMVIEDFIKAVKAGDVQRASEVIAAQNAQLKNDILSKIKNAFEFKVPDLTLQIINAKKVKASGTFTAKGSNWDMNGFSIYFILEKKDHKWLIADTNFASKLSSRFFFSFFVLVLIILMFWLWMLIDCFKRKLSKKALWIIALFVFNIIAAVIYFIVIKRKDFAPRI